MTFDKTDTGFKAIYKFYYEKIPEYFRVFRNVDMFDPATDMYKLSDGETVRYSVLCQKVSLWYQLRFEHLKKPNPG